jgi:hypothetical protein
VPHSALQSASCSQASEQSPLQTSEQRDPAAQVNPQLFPAQETWQSAPGAHRHCSPAAQIKLPPCAE